MSDLSQFVIPRGFRFGAAKAGLKAERPHRLRPHRCRHACQRRRRLHRQSRQRRAAPHRQGASSRDRRQGPRCRHQRRQRQLRRRPARPRRRPRHLRGRGRNVRLQAEEVFPSSTGVIGVPLPAEKLIAALPELATSLGSESDHFQQLAQAILTTDTVEKTAFARIEVSQPEIDGARDPAGSPHRRCRARAPA